MSSLKFRYAAAVIVCSSIVGLSALPDAEYTANPPAFSPVDQMADELRRCSNDAGLILRRIRSALSKAEALERQLKLEKKRSLSRSSDQKSMGRDARVQLGELGRLSKELRELQAGIDESLRSAKRVEKLRSELDAVRQTRLNIERKLADMRVAKFADEERVRELRRQINEFSKRLNDGKAVTRDEKSLQAEIRKERSRREKFLLDIEREAKELDVLEKNALPVEQRLADLRSGTPSLDQQLQELEDARRQLQELQDGNKELREKLDRTSSMKTAAEQRQADLLEQLEACRLNRGTLEADIAELESRHSRIADFTAQNKAVLKTIDELSATCVELERQSLALKGELTGAIRKNRELKSQIRALPAVRRELESEQAQHAALEDDIQSALRVRDKLSSELDVSRRRILVLGDEANSLLEKLGEQSDTRSQVARLKTIRNELNLTLERTEKENRSIQEELRGFPRQISVLESVLRELTTQTAELQKSRGRIEHPQPESQNFIAGIDRSKNDHMSNEVASPLHSNISVATVRDSAIKPPALDLAASEQKLLILARRGVPGDDAVALEQSAKELGRLTSENQNLSKAEDHYQRGIKAWDSGNVDDAIVEFKRTLRYNPDAAGAYYNLGVAYARKGDKLRACRYAYQAGMCYLRHANRHQTIRMILFIQSIDANSPLIGNLRQALADE